MHRPSAATASVQGTDAVAGLSGTICAGRRRAGLAASAAFSAVAAAGCAVAAGVACVTGIADTLAGDGRTDEFDMVGAALTSRAGIFLSIALPVLSPAVAAGAGTTGGAALFSIAPVDDAPVASFAMPIGAATAASRGVTVVRWR